MVESGTEKAPPKVCIVIATYNRGSTLSQVLRTVIAQTETRWEALVIGDACSDDTEMHVSALGDDRIRFINLPERFGEQAGPNSVGMALAQSPFVAFLNHDDYWFPDHLELALKALSEAGTDWFWSRAAFFTNRGAWSRNILFSEASPTGRRLEDLYDAPFFVAEPMSSWVARRDALTRLGPMKLASETRQAPIVEYCHRAYLMGITLTTGDDISVLKDRVWQKPPSYGNFADYAEPMVVQIETARTAELRQTIERDLELSHALGLNRPTNAKIQPVGQSQTAQIDALTGLDLLEMEGIARARFPVSLLSTYLMNRTGEAIAHQPSLTDMISFARGQMQ